MRPRAGRAAPARPSSRQAPVLEVGQGNQIRAGRQLTAADFTRMGLSAPLGLWNLSDLTDVSGNARALTNKGAVPFGVGINGLAHHRSAVRGVDGAGAVHRGYGGGGPVPDQDGVGGDAGCGPRNAARRSTSSRRSATAAVRGGAMVRSVADRRERRRNRVQFDWRPARRGAGSIRHRRRPLAFRVATYDGTRLRALRGRCLDEAAERGSERSVAGVPGPLNIGAYGPTAPERRGAAVPTTAGWMRRSSPPTSSPTTKSATCTAPASPTASSTPAAPPSRPPPSPSTSAAAAAAPPSPSAISRRSRSGCTTSPAGRSPTRDPAA